MQCDNPIFVLSELRPHIWVVALSSYVSLSLYGLAHWIFAYKYWMLSHLLTGSKLKWVRIANISMYLSIFFFQLVVMIVFLYENLKNNTQILWLNVLFWTALFANVFLNLFTFWALGDSFKRLLHLEKTSTNMVANSKMMILHIISYGVFILSLLLYFLSLAGFQSTSFITDLLAITSFISQGFLILILNAIYTHQTK